MSPVLQQYLMQQKHHHASPAAQRTPVRSPDTNRPRMSNAMARHLGIIPNKEQRQRLSSTLSRACSMPINRHGKHCQGPAKKLQSVHGHPFKLVTMRPGPYICYLKAVPKLRSPGWSHLLKHIFSHSIVCGTAWICYDGLYLTCDLDKALSWPPESSFARPACTTLALLHAGRLQ